MIFELVSAFPNPFNSSVMLHYNLYKAGMTQVRIIDIFGREVALFNRYYQTAGQQRFEWDGKNSLGMIVSSGTYFVRIDFEGQSRLLKLLLLR